MNKEEFLEQARRANEEALKDANLSDLSNPYSSVYQGVKTPPKENVAKIPKETEKNRD